MALLEDAADLSQREDGRCGPGDAPADLTSLARFAILSAFELNVVNFFVDEASAISARQGSFADSSRSKLK
jgi:hypothetical protein